MQKSQVKPHSTTTHSLDTRVCSWSLRHCQPVQELSHVTTNAYQGKMLTTMLAAAVAAAHAVHPLDPPTSEEITSALASSRALYPHPQWRVYVTSLLLPSPSLSLPPTMPSVYVDVCHLPWRNLCARVRVGVRTRGGQAAVGVVPFSFTVQIATD